MKKAAILGTGNIAFKHVEAVRAAGERLELVAACDLDPQKAEAFCQQHSIPHAYSDLAALLAEQQPDVVHICTPPGVHKDQIIACLEAGAWAFCEKPLCASLAEMDAIIAAEERTGCYAASVFQVRYGAGGQHLKRLIDTGALGRSLVGICQTTWYRTQEYYDVPWRGKWSTETGGTTMTHGIHEIDLALWLLGDWREVRAMIGTLDRQIEVDDVTMAVAQMADGTLLSVINSAISPRQETYLRLDFQKVTVELLHLYGYSNANWNFTLPPDSPDTAELAHWQAIVEDYPTSQTAQLRPFLDALDSGQRPPVSGADVRRTLEFCAALYKSAITGAAVARGSIQPGDPFYTAMNGGLYTGSRK